MQALLPFGVPSVLLVGGSIYAAFVHRQLIRKQVPVERDRKSYKTLLRAIFVYLSYGAVCAFIVFVPTFAGLALLANQSNPPATAYVVSCVSAVLRTLYQAWKIDPRVPQPSQESATEVDARVIPAIAATIRAQRIALGLVMRKEQQRISKRFQKDEEIDDRAFYGMVADDLESLGASPGQAITMILAEYHTRSYVLGQTRLGSAREGYLKRKANAMRGREANVYDVVCGLFSTIGDATECDDADFLRDYPVIVARWRTIDVSTIADYNIKGKKSK